MENLHFEKTDAWAQWKLVDDAGEAYGVFVGDESVAKALAQILDASERAKQFATAIRADREHGSCGEPLKAIRGMGFLLTAVYVACIELGIAPDADLMGMVTEALKDARGYLGAEMDSMFLAVALPYDGFEDGRDDSFVKRFHAELLGARREGVR